MLNTDKENNPVVTGEVEDTQVTMQEIISWQDYKTTDQTKSKKRNLVRFKPKER